MRHVEITKGLQLNLSGAPLQEITPGPSLARLYLEFSDAWAARPRLLVQPGEHVSRGQVLYRDKRIPEIRLLAPADGTIESVDRDGYQRATGLWLKLSTTDAGAWPEGCEYAPPGMPYERTGVTQFLLDSGWWIRLRQRPYDMLATPGGNPAALFVTAMDTRPLAADAKVVIDHQQAAFDAGLQMLSCLTDGPVYLCQGPGQRVSGVSGHRIENVVFEGAHPAGLAGTHIHCLHPLKEPGKVVWQVDYQDVIAAGRLAQSGCPDNRVVVSLCGDALIAPRLLETVYGAGAQDLLAGEQMPAEPEACLIGGNPLLAGWPRAVLAVGGSNRQICAMRSPRARRRFWSLPVPGRPDYPLGSWPFAAEPVFERVNALKLPIIPMLRTLALGLSDNIARSGLRDLSAEDLSVFSFVCPVGNEYDRLHREWLDDHREDFLLDA